MKVHEATTHLCNLLQTWSVDYSHQSPPMGMYKYEMVSTRVHFGILSNVPIIRKPAFYFFAALVNFIAGKGGNKRKVTTYTS